MTAVTALLAVAWGHAAGGVLLLTAAVLTGQLSVGWLNDLVDADRDREAGRDDKPLARGELSRTAVRRAVVATAGVSALLTLLAGWPAAAAHLAALGSAWAYDLGGKSRAWSPACYAVSFGLLPAFVVLALPGAPWPPLWLVAGGALLGCAAHFLNVLPDLAEDAAAGVRGLPQRLGAARSRAVAAGLMLGACASLALGPVVGGGAAAEAGAAAAVPGGAPWPLAAAVVLIAAGTLCAGLLRARRPGSRAAFNSLLVVALLNVVLLLTTSGAASWAA
ncbi:UbiA family prenyltransferase [Streptomyces lonarensis]